MKRDRKPDGLWREAEDTADLSREIVVFSLDNMKARIRTLYARLVTIDSWLPQGLHPSLSW